MINILWIAAFSIWGIAGITAAENAKEKRRIKALQDEAKERHAEYIKGKKYYSYDELPDGRKIYIMGGIWR